MLGWHCPHPLVRGVHLNKQLLEGVGMREDRCCGEKILETVKCSISIRGPDDWDVGGGELGQRSCHTAVILDKPAAEDYKS